MIDRSVDEPDLLRLHADVLFDTDANGRLIGLNESGDDPAPRLFLARDRMSRFDLFREDVPEETVEACLTIARDLPAWDGSQPDPALFAGLRAALADDRPVTGESGGCAFRFGRRGEVGGDAQARLIHEESADLLERHFPYTRSVLAARSPVVGVVSDGAVVSACFSARARPTACEAGVATEEAYRGRGLAPLVVAAWRDAVEREGRVPLYSTSWGNAASLRVARKLGLVPYADTLSLT